MRRGDLIAGISIAGLVLPEAVAYAGIAGLPPQRAIFAGIAGCFAYWAFGCSRFAIVSPTSSSAAILAATLASLPGDDSFKATAATVIVALVAGFFLLAAVAGLGAMTGFISRPVLRGFAFGLAVTIIIGQLPIMAGVTIQAPDIAHRVVALVSLLPHWNLSSVGTGIAALVTLLFLKRYPAAPGAFLVLVAGVAVSLLFDLPQHGVATVGAIDVLPSWPSIPGFTWAQYSQLAQLTIPLALILFVESWGTIRTLALRHGDTVEANHEFAALGFANAASALVQGMPVGAGFSAGVASEAAGATSRTTSLVAATALIILIVGAGPLVAYLPEAVLAAVVISVLAHALDPGPLIRLWRLDRDQYIALGAAGAVLVLGVLNGMLLAIALSLAAFVRRLATPYIAQLGQLGATRNYVDRARHADATSPPGIVIWRPAEPLFFANAERVLALIAARSHADPAMKAVVVSLEECFDLDSTGLDALIEFDTAMYAAGLPVQYARVHDHVRDLLVSGHADHLLARSSYSVDDAVVAAQALARDSEATR
jgi:MFS superfamily sulfate permease-like transporter